MEIVLSIVFGLFTLVIFIGVGESFQDRGAVAEAVAAGLAVALYLAFAEFLVAPRESRGLREKWPTMIAMGAPLLVICINSALPVFFLGCLGILTGAAVAGRVTFKAVSPTSCRRLLLASAVVVAAVAIVLVVGVIPLTAKAGTFPDGTPGSAVSVFWGFVVLNALVAACLGFFGFRVGDGYRPPFGALAFLAFLVFMSACALAAPAFAFRGHGPALLIASNLALLCLVAEIGITVLVGSTALRLPEAGAA
jgi:hypothetical protein